ncbi:isopeptide-forming domain-containing fimbrial protein [Arcanobacterium pinnipediorum]|uniref:Isopeptide-forming domain-containing fimbrial protein n=1 Tax=Arcanobacterium pinnipediorum TaxID=1503041 RepID=A0ABY5AGF6_9ACTO|nr:isopeptide-forming domain-containing fimbrial protein [Arcanobacterium pinnipediorum]USR78942.1 isopeptide-forming domain-containing fimbrial protein [Arcanobacterium pinnipediorum]
MKRFTGSVAAILLTTVLAMSGFVPLAQAEPVAYEFEGEWVDAPERTLSGFDVLTSRWRLDINDDASAPANDEVEENNVVTLSAENAVFNRIPTICANTETSSISTDGSVLTCDLGTLTEGSALNFTSSLLVTGSPGSHVKLSGQFRGKIVDNLAPIPIYTQFAMDAKFDGGTPYSQLLPLVKPEQYLLEFPFSISHAHNSPAGPDTVTFDITTTRRVEVDPSGHEADLVVMDEGACQPNDRQQPGYPFSDGQHSADQQTAFPTCTLEKTGTDTFRLTLSGLKYDQPAPQLDSNAEPLPRGMDVIAAGKLRFKLRYTANGNTVNLTASAPQFQAVDGSSFTDDPSNNTNSVPVVLGYYTGGWALSYMRPKSYPGIPWTDTYRAPVGATVMSFVGHTPTRASESTDHWVCGIIDHEKVELQKVRVAVDGSVKPHFFYDDSFPTNPDGTRDIWYYVGETLHNPGSDQPVDPNDFACGGETSTTDPEAGNQPEWTRTPADLSHVKAVKARLSKNVVSSAGRRGQVYVAMELKIKDTVKIGTPIWTWGYVLSDGATNWNHSADKVSYFDRSLDPKDVKPYGTLTPDLKYPFVGPGRDVLRVVGSEPYVDKQVARTQYLPNEEAEFSLTYGLESNLAQPFPDSLTLTDILPQGLTYVAGSTQYADGSPAPEPTVTNVAATNTTPAHTQLVWNFNDVVPNDPAGKLTYRATVPADAQPGQSFASSVIIESQGISRTAQATFTVPTSGLTNLRKSAVESELKPDKDATATGKWMVELHSADPRTSNITDVIDLLPTPEDGAGTTGKTMPQLVKVTASLPGSKVYYTTVPRAMLNEDPAHPSNGSLGQPSDIWSEDFSPNATAVRVIGGPLVPLGVQKIILEVKYSGLEETTTFVNVAVGRAENTRLRMRSSALMQYTKPTPDPDPEPTPDPDPEPTPQPEPPVPASPTPDQPKPPTDSPNTKLAKTGSDSVTLLALSSLLLLLGAGLLRQRNRVS